ncbi:MAG: pyridoxal phosphate-dependent aminotransferase [Roseburia sp.]
MQNGHGGDIYRNEVELDFSVNTNPYGMPQSVREALLEAVDACETYPDITCEALKESLSRYDDLRKEWLLCGNGASELFNAIVHAVRPKKILLPVPSFSGYLRAAQVEEAEVIPYQLKEKDDFRLTEEALEELTAEIDLLFLANPNNPVGTSISVVLLEQIVEKCQKNKTIVVIDECFFPFMQQESPCKEVFLARYPNVIVVRAFTKTYAIPGVRLGYLAVSDVILLEKIEKNLSEWNLSSFAQAAGRAAAKEKEYLTETGKKIEEQRKWLQEELEKIGICVFPSEANFLLLKTEEPLYEALLEKKILIRDCSNYQGLQKGFYRIAVKREEENKRLLEEIRKMQRKKRRVQNGTT